MQSERAYDGRTASGEWGLALGDRAQTMMLDLVGLSFIPLYRFFGPISMLLLLVVFIVGMVRIVVTVMVRAIIITRTRGCGPWIFASIWGTLYSLALSPIRWADEAARRIAEDVEQKMVNEANHAPRDVYPLRQLRKAREEAEPLWRVALGAFKQDAEVPRDTDYLGDPKPPK